jgi:hypothetical protein
MSLHLRRRLGRDFGGAIIGVGVRRTMGTAMAGTLLNALVSQHFWEWSLELAERGALLGAIKDGRQTGLRQRSQDES